MSKNPALRNTSEPALLASRWATKPFPHGSRNFARSLYLMSRDRHGRRTCGDKPIARDWLLDLDFERAGGNGRLNADDRNGDRLRYLSRRKRDRCADGLVIDIGLGGSIN